MASSASAGGSRLGGFRSPGVRPARRGERPLPVVGDEQMPLGEAHAVDEQVDRGVGRTVELDHGAQGQPERAAERQLGASELGPHAQLDVAEGLDQADASRRSRPSPGGASCRRRAPASLACRARRAPATMRTTKALGTSWISRQDSPPIRNVVEVACGDASVGLGGGRRVVEHAGVRRGDLDLLAEHHADRAGRGGHHLVGGLGDGRQLELGQLGSPARRPRRRGAPMAAGQRARAGGGRTKMLAPVTPST